MRILLFTKKLVNFTIGIYISYMFSILEKIKKDSFEKSSNEDKAILITSLMIECAKSDDNFSEEEIGLIKNILKKKL